MIIVTEDNDGDIGVMNFTNEIYTMGSGSTIQEALEDLTEDAYPYKVLAKVDSVEEIKTQHPELFI